MSKKIIFIVILFMIVVIAFISYGRRINAPGNNYEGDGNESYVKDDATWQKYRNADLGFSFEYRTSPLGYTLLEEGKIEGGSVTLVKALTLINTKEYQELLASSVPREAPPVISVGVFDNKAGASLETWVKNNTQFSLYFDPAQILSEQSVGGARALTYFADGLYPSTVVVVDNNFKIYVIVGQYNAKEDTIYADFEKFLGSLVFF